MVRYGFRSQYEHLWIPFARQWCTSAHLGGGGSRSKARSQVCAFSRKLKSDGREKDVFARRVWKYVLHLSGQAGPQLVH